MASESMIRSRLSSIGRRVQLATCARGGMWALTLILGSLILVCGLDNLIQLPAGVRLIALIALVVAGGAALVARVGRPLTQRPGAERVARTIERRFGVGDNLLINAAQFEGATLGAEEKAFAGEVITRCRTYLGALDTRGLFDLKQLAWWTMGGVLTVLAWLLYVGILPQYAGNALLRLIAPLGDVPMIGPVSMTIDPSHDLTVYEGATVVIHTLVSPRDGLHPPADMTPRIFWQDGAERMSETSSRHDTSAQQLAMTPGPRRGQPYVATFSDLRSSFSFRVQSAGTWSKAFLVTVLPIPRIRDAQFSVTLPPYAGGLTEIRPGPPSELAVMPKSQVAVSVTLDQRVTALSWRGTSGDVPLQNRQGHWQGAIDVRAAGDYAIVVPDKGLVLARGAIRIDNDHPPQVSLESPDANRFVNPGITVALAVTASDDHGLHQLRILRHDAASDGTQVSEVRRWTYIGPPGNKGPVTEKQALVLDPADFLPGHAYVLEATASDFCPPAGQTTRSGPVILRIRSLADITLPDKDPMNGAFEKLKAAVIAQQESLAGTTNATANLAEVIAKHDLPGQRGAILGSQGHARDLASEAERGFAAIPDGKVFADRLLPLTTGEMPWVLSDAAKLVGSDADVLGKRLSEISKRQRYILEQLISLLGSVADARAKAAAAALKGIKPPGSATDQAEALKQDLNRFAQAQQRLLKRSKALLEHGPLDLTDKQQEELGVLARDEAKWARFLQQKLTDFSNLPAQDFTDASMSKQLNEVYQEVQGATKDLYGKKVDLAVPLEQSGIENAKSLVNNLEKWLASAPDNTKWSMEADKAPADIANAELPSEMEDIVGDLLDKEDSLDKDVDDASSPWMDNIDKGAGWGAADGPISDMSAKGVTGNTLPKNDEIGGRSGEGRNGRSSGQMVEDHAEGKGGRETPTRLDPSPFERGSVKDTDSKDTGGATGGGKLSGAAGEGLTGPTPPPQQRIMQRLAGAQAQLRQEAGALDLKLRTYHMPTGDLESAMAAMAQVEKAAHSGNGGAVRQRYSQVIDALSQARDAMQGIKGLQHETTRLPTHLRDDVHDGSADKVPHGYEDMVGRYFQALAEQGQ